MQFMLISGLSATMSIAAGRDQVAIPSDEMARTGSRKQAKVSNRAIRTSSGNLPQESTRNHDFLPAVLSAIESPPSPRRIHVIGTIVALLACTLTLCYFGFIPEYTLAPGRIQAVGRTKVVEPREPGEIEAIHAGDGDRVKKGDVVVELDPTEAAATRAIIASKLLDLRAQIARDNIEIAAGHDDPVDSRATVSWDSDIPSGVCEREANVLQADLSQLAATLANLNAKRKAAEALRDSYSTDVDSQKALVAVTTERVNMNQTLQEEGWASRLRVLNILSDLQQQQTYLSKLQGEVADAEATVAVVDGEIIKAREAFVTSATQSLATDERQLEDLQQQLIKADQKLADMTLQSPVDGVVQKSAVTTIGQVVKPGQQLMAVVPEDRPLEIIAYVANTDIGFIKVGQQVDIRVDTFPYSTYGSIPGTITSIAADALPADTKKNSLETAALDGDVSQTTAAQRTGNIVFPIVVEPSQATLNIDGENFSLSSGMTVKVDILTENRRAIDYIVSPFAELLSTAAHEK